MASSHSSRRGPASLVPSSHLRRHVHGRPAGLMAPDAFCRLVQERPSVSAPYGVHSRWLTCLATCCPASATRCHPHRMFRPRGSSPPRRLPPPWGPWACCIPQPTLGFIGFWPARSRDAALAVLPGACAHPPDAHALQSLAPSDPPCRLSPGACLPPRACWLRRQRHLEALLVSDSRSEG